MMVRVDLDSLTIRDLRQVGVLQNLDFVSDLALGRRLPVIENISAELRGHILIEGQPKQRHLQRIPLGDSGPEFGYRSLAVVPGIEVGATTQQQAVQSVEERLSRPKAE